MQFRISTALVAETFTHFRQCGRGARECQVVWTSPWDDPRSITHVVHPGHRPHAGGFEVDPGWLNQLWLELSHRRHGIRVQVHTHPGEAFHSAVDDQFPVIHAVGFLSLVIPHFGLGGVGFDNAYLAEIQPTGEWRKVSIASRLELVP
jgi:hypothetical protein